MPQRREIQFNSVADIVADVRKLRKGYETAGQWTLPQVSYHLNRTLLSSMKPGPYPDDTPEQIAAKPGVRTMLMTGKIPPGIVAPSETAPPATVPESAIDEFLETLVRFDHYHKPLAPHWRFGRMDDGDRRRHQLLHCAHHLSHLVPTQPSANAT